LQHFLNFTSGYASVGRHRLTKTLRKLQEHSLSTNKTVIGFLWNRKKSGKVQNSRNQVKFTLAPVYKTIEKRCTEI